MSSNGEAEEIVVLKSSDGQKFEVAKSVAMMMTMLHHAIEDNTTKDPIPLPKVKAEVLTSVLEYCTKHAKVLTPAVNDSADAEPELKTWDKNFIDVDTYRLYDILTASTALSIDGLINLAAGKVADMIKGKSLEEIRRILHIKNDFTPEEEEKLRLENQWAYGSE